MNGVMSLWNCNWEEASTASTDEEYNFEEATLTPLSAIAEAFEELAGKIVSKSNVLRLDDFCDACSIVSVLFNVLGIAFKFAEMEYVSKVQELAAASKRFKNIQDVLDVDVVNDAVKAPGSLSRNLRRVRQGLDLVRSLFEQFLSTDDYSLKEAASTAYTQVFAQYHTWAIRTAVAAGMYALPTRDQLLMKLNENESSAEREMRRYIEAATPVIQYIDELFTSRNVDLDW